MGETTTLSRQLGAIQVASAMAWTAQTDAMIAGVLGVGSFHRGLTRRERARMFVAGLRWRLWWRMHPS